MVYIHTSKNAAQNEGPCLSICNRVPDSGYVDDFVVMALTPEGLQRLIDAVLSFCLLMRMVISIPKMMVLVFNVEFPGPLQWLCNSELLQIGTQFKYMGLIFKKLGSLQATFSHLKQNMWAAWSLLKRQYGCLQRLASVGLLFRLYSVCVPPASS